MMAGGGLGAGYLLDRGADGYVSATIDRLESPTAAITTEGLSLVTDPGSSGWLLSRLGADIRLKVTGIPADTPVFVGVGPAADVDTFLGGVAHDQLIDSASKPPTYRHSIGDRAVEPPTEQSFWVESATGAGTQQLNWTATNGAWAAVLMNADGSPGVAAEATVEAKAGFVLPLALILLGVGVAVTGAAVLLIVAGAAGRRRPRPPALPGEDLAGTHSGGPSQTLMPVSSSSPVTLSAVLDPGLSRWLWLVKWVLVIPHLVVLSFLWVAFMMLTVVAGIAILFTGIYPRGIFDFNVGVLRWSWRVEYYATTGGIGTDNYPPFRLGPAPDYPANLDIAYPGRLSRGLVLVKWWLLALPHYVIVALLVGGSLGWVTVNGERIQLAPVSGGVLGIVVLVAGVALLLTGRYPRPIFDLIVGLNRWIYRVIAYAALMTDRYPPFRLDQGGAEPSGAPLLPPPVGPADAVHRERDRQDVVR